MSLALVLAGCAQPLAPSPPSQPVATPSVDAGVPDTRSEPADSVFVASAYAARSDWPRLRDTLNAAPTRDEYRRAVERIGVDVPDPLALGHHVAVSCMGRDADDDWCIVKLAECTRRERTERPDRPFCGDQLQSFVRRRRTKQCRGSDVAAVRLASVPPRYALQSGDFALVEEAPQGEVHLELASLDRPEARLSGYSWEIFVDERKVGVAQQRSDRIGIPQFGTLTTAVPLATLCKKLTPTTLPRAVLDVLDEPPSPR